MRKPAKRRKVPTNDFVSNRVKRTTSDQETFLRTEMVQCSSTFTANAKCASAASSIPMDLLDQDAAQATLGGRAGADAEEHSDTRMRWSYWTVLVKDQGKQVLALPFGGPHGTTRD